MKKFNFEEQDQGLNNILNKNAKKSLEKIKAEKANETQKAEKTEKPSKKESSVAKKASTPVKEEKPVEIVEPIVEEVVVPEVNEIAEEKITENVPQTVPATTKTISNILASEKRETKSVKKIILIRPSLSEALKSYSKEYGISENEVINRILESYIQG